MRCFVVTKFLLTTASRGPSALAEPLVIQYRNVTNTNTHTHTETERHTTTAYTARSIALRGKNRHIARPTKYNYQATSVD